MEMLIILLLYLQWIVLQMSGTGAQDDESALALYQVAKNDYLTLSPKTFTPGVPLKIATLVFNPEWVESRFSFELVDASDMAMSRVENIYQPGVLSVTDLPIPSKVESGQYYGLRLKISGPKLSRGITEDRRLLLSPSTASILIQLDKPVYKGEDCVQVRILAINPDLSPYGAGKLTVYILDSKERRVAQWLNQKTPRGVLVLELPLGLYPPAGKWTVNAMIEGQALVSKAFQVSHLQLPIFEVALEILPFQVVGSDVSGTIKVTYKFGEPVHCYGLLRVRMEGNQACEGREHVQSITLPEGDLEFRIPYGVLETLCPTPLNGTLLIEAMIIDTATAIESKVTTPTKFYRTPYKVEFCGSNPASFKPSLTYNGFVKITQPDGKPLRKYEEGLFLEASTNSGGEPFFSKTYPIDEDGNVRFQIPIPANALTLFLTAELENSKVASKVQIENVQESNINSFMTVSLVTLTPSAEDVTDFEINSTHPLTNIFYLVLSKGSIVASGSIKVEDGKSSTRFSLTLTKDMSPLARIVAFHIKDRELIIDALNFRVEGIFKNLLRASFVSSQMAPGKDAELLVTTKPGSLVCVLSLDKRFIFHSRLYDITPNDV